MGYGLSSSSEKKGLWVRDLISEENVLLIEPTLGYLSLRHGWLPCGRRGTSPKHRGMSPVCTKTTAQTLFTNCTQ